VTWDQFIATMLTLVTIATYRLINRYLPPKTQVERATDPPAPPTPADILEEMDP
jgi:hypothetical protein